MNQTFSVALNQPAGQRNFSAYWDDDYTLTLRVYATDSPDDTVPIDLTGAILVFKVAQYPYSSSVVVSGQDGVFTFDRPFRACGAREDYTIELTLDGDTTTVAYGTVVVAPRNEQYGTGCGPWGRYNTGAFIGPLQLLVDQAKVASDAAVVAAALAVPAAEAAVAANISAQQALADMRAESAWLTAFFLPGDADYTAAWNRAGLAARRVLVPPGTYTMGNAGFVANTQYFGVGDTSILAQKSGFELFTYDSGSPIPANNLANIKLCNMQLRGRCDTDGFNEQRHLLRTSGITNFVAEEVYFNGFQGDAWYLGSGVGTERHNYNCKSLRNRYNGINKANRNAFTIIDCDGFLSDYDDFENCTQPNMPGAIDIEPNRNAYHVVRNITINCPRARNIGGNVAVYTIDCNSDMTNPPTNIKIINPQADNFSAAMIFVRTMSGPDGSIITPTAASPSNKISIQHPVGSNGKYAYRILASKGVEVISGEFTDMTDASNVGVYDSIRNVHSRAYDVKDLGSIHRRCGKTQGIGLYVFDVDHFRSNSLFDDCGTGAGGSSNAIDFGNGVSSYVDLSEIEVRNTTGKTQIAIQKEVAHTFTPATNRMRSARLNGLTNNFQAYDSDEVVSQYPTATPIIVGGGTTVGTATYTRQTGLFQMAGKNVDGRADLAWSATTGAAGPLQVSAPMPATGNVLRNMQEVVIESYTGFTVTGTLLGRFFTGASMGGVAGVFRFYDRAANGTEAVINIGSGPGALAFKFHYVTA